jgi:outer membrane lipoprotein SlyB
MSLKLLAVVAMLVALAGCATSKRFSEDTVTGGYADKAMGWLVRCVRDPGIVTHGNKPILATKEMTNR